MKPRSVVTLGISLVAFAGSVLALAGADSGYPPYVKKELYADNDLRGKTAPKFAVGQWLTGAAPATKGKVVLIDFWATWCPPCRALIPELNGYQKKFGKDLVVIGVSDEDAAVVKKFMGSTKMAYNVAVDPKKQMEKVVGVKGIPHVLVITPDGVVRWQGFPLSDDDTLTEAKLSQIIEASKAAKS